LAGLLDCPSVTVAIPVSHHGARHPRTCRAINSRTAEHG
jgi:hypothetical protein